MIVSQDGYIIIESPSLSDRTTIHLGGEAIAEVRVSDMDCLDRLPGVMSRIGGQVRVMGEGSNIIAGSGKMPLILLSLAQTDTPRVIEDKDASVLLREGQFEDGVVAGTGQDGIAYAGARPGLPASVTKLAPVVTFAPACVTRSSRR